MDLNRAERDGPRADELSNEVVMTALQKTYY